MEPAFLPALIDSLLPGGVLSETVTAPPASALGMAAWLAHAADLDKTVDSILRAVAEQAGSEASFIAADENARDAIIDAVQQVDPAGFGIVLSKVLARYYEDPVVLGAFHWRPEPPQPLGHAIQESDPIPTNPGVTRSTRFRMPQ